MHQRHRFWGLFGLFLVSACAPPEDAASLDTLLTVPENASLGDEVFVLSPGSDALVRLKPGPQGESPYTELEQNEVSRVALGAGAGHLVANPEGSSLLTLTHAGNRHSLAIFRAALTCGGETPVDLGCVEVLEARPLHDRLALSPDGRFAISYISAEAAASSTEDVINPNEIGVYDLPSSTVRFVTVGYAPSHFAFTEDDPGPRVVVLTATRVVLVDLLSGETVPRELTLSTSSQVTPQSVVLSSDNSFALVSLAGSPDLFTFDLTQENLPINILSLSGASSGLTRSASGAETLALSTSRTKLNVIHHESFEVDVYTLEQVADRILVVPNSSKAVLYDATGSVPYLQVLDLSRKTVQVYRLDSPCRDVLVSPDGGALVIYYVDNGSSSSTRSPYAVAILNLVKEDRAPNPILVSSYPLGAAFHQGSSPGTGQVLVLLEGEQGGLTASIDLSTYDVTVVDLPPYPGAILPIEDGGRYVVLHNASLGVASVFPGDAPERVQLVVNFMVGDLL